MTETRDEIRERRRKRSSKRGGKAEVAPEKTEYERIQEWKRVEAVLGCDVVRVAYLFGDPGYGKTHAAYHYGRLGQGFHAVTITEETSAAELRGHFIFRGGDAIWHDGPIVRAMREGARLVLNELRYANGDLQGLLYPILEAPETAKLTLPSGETIHPAPGFHVVITDNLPPDDLPEALQDRFTVKLRVTGPHPEALKRLDPALRRAALAADEIEDDRRITSRSWLHLQQLYPLFGLEEACILVFGPDRGVMIHQALRLAGHIPEGCA